MSCDVKLSTVARRSSWTTRPNVSCGMKLAAAMYQGITLLYKGAREFAPYLWECWDGGI